VTGARSALKCLAVGRWLSGAAAAAAAVAAKLVDRGTRRPSVVFDPYRTRPSWVALTSSVSRDIA